MVLVSPRALGPKPLWKRSALFGVRGSLEEFLQWFVMRRFSRVVVLPGKNLALFHTLRHPVRVVSGFSSPVSAVERTIADRFGHVNGLNFLISGQIRYCATRFQYAVIGAR